MTMIPKASGADGEDFERSIFWRDADKKGFMSPMYVEEGGFEDLTHSRSQGFPVAWARRCQNGLASVLGKDALNIGTQWLSVLPSPFAEDGICERKGLQRCHRA